MNYLYLILESLLPVLVTVIFKLLLHKTKFKKLPYWAKQTIYAIVFGGLAIFGTECGVAINEGVINVRDAPPIIAGLFFGAPAGIAAGLIGGIERLITGYFITGRAATRIACSVATILAGILASTLRIVTRKNKKIPIATSCALVFVIEVIHMLLVYITNTNNLEFVIGIYRKVVGPMIVANVVSVFLASWADVLVDRYFAKEKLFKSIREIHLSGAIQQTTLIIAMLTFVIGFASISVIQTRISKENIQDTLNTTSQTVSSQGTSLVNYAIGGDYANDLYNLHYVKRYDFNTSFEGLRKDPVSGDPEAYEGCYEGYIVYADSEHENKMKIFEQYGDNNRFGDEQGYVDNDPLFIALMEKLQTAPTGKFNALSNLRESCHPDTEGKYQDVLYSISYFDHIFVPGEDPKPLYIILSMNSEMINSCIDRNQLYILNNQTYSTGITVIFDKDKNFIGSSRNTFDKDKPEDMKEAKKLLELKGFDTLNEINFLNNSWYSVASEGKLIYTYSIVTVDDAELPARVSMYSSSFLFTIAVGIIFLVANVLIDRMIVRKMEKVGDALDKITGDKLNTKVNVYGFDEFNKLSDGINHTVGRLKGYIENEKKRMSQDLEFAKSIQKGTLPLVFPNATGFDLNADMVPAKQVGGDFYDFFLLPNDRLFFLIADVSGKGVPAAMFMMKSETLIKSLVQANQMSLDKVMITANNELCKNNEAQMFVTCWCGILNIKTGHVDFVNAGHNPPIIKRKGHKFEEIKMAKNFVLAAMENIPFRLESVDLKAGDEIFIYTDGVTEATNKAQKLYGMDRLLKFMNGYKYHSSKDMIQGIMKQLDNFQKDVDQADDITMLMIRYKTK